MDRTLSRLSTEQPSTAYENLDTASSLEVASMMNEAERQVAIAVSAVLPQVAKGIDVIVSRMKLGGRLFYIGAGTSGRLGILDAAECPPTFNTPPSLVQAIIAGGHTAVFEASEGAEDDEAAGADDILAHGFSERDVLTGIAASGRTPYVLGALKAARAKGAATLAVTCNRDSEAGRLADVAIEVDTGPEVLMGSTRLKAGSAQKMVLNMLSTGTMVQMGKVYRNLMVDMKATNAKLVERSKRIIMHATGVSYDAASEVLSAAGGQVKKAILMVERQVDAKVAEALLSEANGFLRVALELAPQQRRADA